VGGEYSDTIMLAAGTEKGRSRESRREHRKGAGAEYDDRIAVAV
jgi:hypothetical protein